MPLGEQPRRLCTMSRASGLLCELGRANSELGGRISGSRTERTAIGEVNVYTNTSRNQRRHERRLPSLPVLPDTRDVNTHTQFTVFEQMHGGSALTEQGGSNGALNTWGRLRKLSLIWYSRTTYEPSQRRTVHLARAHSTSLLAHLDLVGVCLGRGDYICISTGVGRASVADGLFLAFRLLMKTVAAMSQRTITARTPPITIPTMHPVSHSEPPELSEELSFLVSEDLSSLIGVMPSSRI